MSDDHPLFFGNILPVDVSLDQLISACRSLLSDRSFPTLRLWRERGGLVFGHFQVYAPEEIAHAAGMLPFKFGCVTSQAVVGDAHFGSYLCTLIKHSFDLAKNRCLALDLLVVPSICDAARNLAAVWSRNFSCPSRTLYLPQNSASPYASEYLLHEYTHLADAVAELTRQPPDSERLRASMVIYNRNRSLLRELYALKARRPCKLAVDEYYLLTAVGGLLPREEHNLLLETALRLLADRETKRHDRRIDALVSGCFCEQPPLAMLEAIGRSCHVLDDDLLIGLRWLTQDVGLQGDPLASLARAYGELASYSPVQHDNRRSGAELLVRRVRETGARAVILAAPKMCEPGLEELVPVGIALEQAAIPYCICEFEQSMTSFEMLELQLETFAENLLYADPAAGV